VDPLFGEFIGTRKYATSFNFLAASLEEEDGKNDRLLVENEFEFMEMHHRPVYFKLTGLYKDDYNIIMFTGTRWILTTSESFPPFNQKKHTLDDIITHLKEDFHTFWSDFTISFVSEPVRIDTASDLLSTPEGIKWYTLGNSELDNANTKEKTDVVAADTVFLCAACTNGDGSNPCQSGGYCEESTKRCDCSSNRASGAMCQLKSIGDGYCDPYFNEKIYESDGGDCCRATCLSEPNKCGYQTDGNDRSVYVGYPSCASKRYSTCRDKARSCWNQNSDTVSSGGIRNAESGYSLSLSANGRIFAIGEPGIDRVRLFRADGSQWVQLGESLYGEQPGSRFGESVSLSDDGITLVIGASKFISSISTSSSTTANDNIVDTNKKKGMYQGQVSIYKLRRNEWNLAEESPTDETIHSNISQGQLGAKLAMSTDAKIMYLAFPFSGIYGGVVVLMQRNSNHNDQGGTFFGKHDGDDNRSFYISQDVDKVGYQPLRNLGRSLSISSSGHMAAFGGKGIKNQKDYVIVYSYIDSNINFAPVGSTIQGCCGILSGDGRTLVVVTAKNAKGEEIAVGTELNSSSFSQVYHWDNQEEDWLKQGNLIDGEASSLSFDGLSVILITSDDEIFNYVWKNDVEQQWEYRSTVGGRQKLIDAVMLQSSEKSGVDSFLIVGVPFDENGGYTNVYELTSYDHENKHEDVEFFDIAIDNRESLVRIEITTDANPHEIIWEIRNPATQKILASGGPYDTKFNKTTTLVETAKIPTDIKCKEFVIYDTGGDGLCCDHGLGSYSLFVAGEVIQSGREYDWSDDRVRFGICDENQEIQLQCESDETLFNIQLVTDNYPTETSWMLTKDQSGEIIAHQNDFLEPLTEYNQQICIPSDSCINFTIMDSGGDGLCCEEGFGNYIVTIDGEAIKKGSDFFDSETISLGSSCSRNEITNTKSDSCADNYSQLQVKIKTDDFPLETRWFLHFFPINNTSEVNSIILGEGGPYEKNDESHVEEICIPDNYCTVFEIYDSGNNGFDPTTSGGSGYSLSLEGKTVHSVAGNDFTSYDFFTIGGNRERDCRSNFVNSFHVIQQHKREKSETLAIPITCSDEIQNYCEAPTSCARPEFDPIGINFGAIALIDSKDVRWTTNGDASGGTWVTKGAYSLSFGNMGTCIAKCTGQCSISCNDDDLIFRLQIYKSSSPPDDDEHFFVSNETATTSSWKLTDYNDKSVILAEGSNNKYKRDDDKASILVQVGRTCIPYNACTALTMSSSSNSNDLYALHINGEMIKSGVIDSQDVVHLGRNCPSEQWW